MGDFHGKFPRQIESIIKKQKIDLVLVDGDYPPFSLKKEFFKNVYAKPNLNLWDFVGKRKYMKAVIADHNAAERVIKRLNKLKIPVFSVVGNHDHIADDVMDIKKNEIKWKWAQKRLNYVGDLLKKYKNIKRIDYSYARFKEYIIIGARGHSFPGKVKSKAYKKHKAKLERLFKKFSKQNKQGKVIFLIHNSPYKTKLDKVTAKDAHKKVKNEHVGSKMFKRIIKKYQPILCISGHIDESFGKQKIGKTTAVNCGAIHDGRCAIIEITGKKVKVKFIKGLK